MYSVKILASENYSQRSKVAFSINQKKTRENNNEILVILDYNTHSDYDVGPSFSTMIIVSPKANEDFASEIIKNARHLPLLVGMKEPADTNVAKYRTLIRAGSDLPDFTDEKAAGHIKRDIYLEEMRNDDYLNDIYNKFSAFLPKIKKNAEPGCEED